ARGPPREQRAPAAITKGRPRPGLIPTTRKEARQGAAAHLTKAGPVAIRMLAARAAHGRPLQTAISAARGAYVGVPTCHPGRQLLAGVSVLYTWPPVKHQS